MDVSAWRHAPMVTVLQAACLWVDVAPKEYWFLLTEAEREAASSWRQVLVASIMSGELQPADSERTLPVAKATGNFDGCHIARADLIALAEKHGWLLPAFLRPVSAVTSTLAPPAPDANQSDAPAVLNTAVLPNGLVSVPTLSPTERAARDEALRVLSHRPGSPMPPHLRRNATTAPAPTLRGSLIVEQAEISAGMIPTYTPPPIYNPDMAPNEFLAWVEDQQKAGTIITVDMAENAMRGPKNAAGGRAGGLLRPGKNLARNTIRKWVKALPAGVRADKGTPPRRMRTST